MKKRAIIIFSIVLITLVGLWGWNVYHTPLAPPPPDFESQFSPTPGPTNQLFNISPEQDEMENSWDLGFDLGETEENRNIPGISEAVKEKTVEAEPICGGPPVMYILGTGVDGSGDIHFWGLSDIIFVTRLDLVNKEASVLSIPRDLWVPMYGLEENDVTEFKINSAIFYGNIYEYPGGGPVFLAKTLYDNFGIQIDHYISVNKTAFVSIINSLGGLVVTFPEKSESGIDYIYYGTVHFSGEEALSYVRYRKDHAWNRSDRALFILQAAKDQVLKPKNILKIFDLAKRLKYGVVTDLSPADISLLMCVASEINLDTFNFYEIGPEFTDQTYIGKYWVLLPKEDLVNDLIQDFLNGEPAEYKP